jgi:hypothetical protein
MITTNCRCFIGLWLKRVAEDGQARKRFAGALSEKSSEKPSEKEEAAGASRTYLAAAALVKSGCYEALASTRL